mgnify:CR=1 FL=1
MEQKIGQLFMIGISGTELTSEEAKFIVDNNIGGIIIFSRNIESPKQLHKLCTDLHALSDQQSDKAPLFLSIKRHTEL